MAEHRRWHTLDLDETFAALDSGFHGLEQAEAERRLAEYGPNEIEGAHKISKLAILWAQIKNPLVFVLLAAAAISLLAGKTTDAIVIGVVIVFNSLIGFFQEYRAEAALEALKAQAAPEAEVVRDCPDVGECVEMRVPTSEIVPGDLILLDAGTKVPADARLIEAANLEVEEAMLTGESLSSRKTLAPLTAEDLPVADRTNLAYASSLVSTGQGVGVVVATGDRTEVGRISGLLAETEALKTPLTRKIAEFSRVLLYVIVGLAVVTALVGVLRGGSVVDMFNAAVALAVGAIPEGLPAAVTITLAIGVSRMARRRAIIRKLPAVETLGGTTVICSDKTGTLTENQMTVQRVIAASDAYEVTGGGYAPEGEIQALEDADGLDGDGADGNGAEAAQRLTCVLRAGLLCNDSSVYLEEGAWHISGDPTEAALIVSAGKGGLNHEHVQYRYPRVDTLPFESEHRYMATLHRVGEEGAPDKGHHVAYVKGAVERVLPRCSSQQTGGRSTAALDREAVDRQAEQMAAEGLRVLAFAAKYLPAETGEITHEHVESDLVFLGLQGMIDPPRAEAKEAVKACHAAGINVKMITGDHALTATAIARKLDLQPDLRADGAGSAAPALTGRDLATLSDADLADTIEKTAVFARVSPEQKLRLVTALQSRGHVVAMTGDGVNDAPALRQADIGVAMGITGTEVAKEAADMILTNDNFASIEAAVEEGRGVFDNLTKFIAWTLPTNLAEGLVILVAVLAGAVLPILPVQALWINMTTGVLLGIMLAFEAKEEGIMQRPPRSPDAALLGPTLVTRIVIVGVLLLAGSFGLFELAQARGEGDAVARSVATNVIVFGEIFYLFNCRSLTRPSWRLNPFSNRLLVLGVIVMIALQLAYTYLPFMNRLFGTAAMPLSYWGWILAAAVVVHVVVEIEKSVRRRRVAMH